MEKSTPEQPPALELSPEIAEKIARKFVQTFLVPKIPDLVSVILYGSSITGKRSGLNDKRQDVDLIIVTERDEIEPEIKQEIKSAAIINNIHILWEPSSWKSKNLEGEFLHKIKEYKVLFGIDYLKEYYPPERFE